MITYESPEQVSVNIGDHIEGIGTVLDPDDEKDFYVRAFIKWATEEQPEVKRLEAENEKLRDLCEWLLTPYRLGAVTGEGVDKKWCRETYDGGSYRLRELGVEV